MLMMLPFEAPTIFEGIHKSYFRMPRVVKDQRAKFDNDDLFRQLAHESAVKYTGFKERPLEERQMKFIANCQEGHTEVSVVQSGNQFTLMFNPAANPAYNNEGCDFDKELGKVHIKSGFILNGVCVLWRGWIDLQRLEGFGCLEFDEYRAYIEDAMAKQQIDKQQAAAGLAGGGCAPGRLAPAGQHMGAAGPLLAPPSCLAPAGASPMIAAPAADPSGAHYGNAAIAAAAAAAFHQALGVGPPPGAVPAPHALPALALALAPQPQPQPPQPPPPPPPPHLHAYTNGGAGAAHAPQRASPPGANNENSLAAAAQHARNKQQQPTASAQATKRAADEQRAAAQLDDVDVVSDMSPADEFAPPRRIFKSSDPMLNHPQHLQQRARRAV